jgi:hypothetical protein
MNETPAERQAAMDEASSQILTYREGIDMVRPTEAFGMCYYAFLAGIRFERSQSKIKGEQT